MREQSMHTTECTFQAFLSFNCAKLEGHNRQHLRMAYYWAKDLPLPSEPISEDCPKCNAANEAATLRTSEQ